MLVIFDWDGTLLDSLAKITRCMQYAAEDAKLEPLGENEIRSIIGLGLQEAVSILYPEAAPAALGLLSERYSHHYVIEDRSPCSLYPGVEITLDELKAAGHHIAVATGKSRRGLDRMLGNLGWQDHFHATRCADETRSKPHPLMLSELLSELDVHVEDALMVGDTEFDLAMAAQLGMRRVGVSYGAHPQERLRQHQPEAIINRVSELLQLV